MNLSCVALTRVAGDEGESEGRAATSQPVRGGGGGVNQRGRVPTVGHATQLAALMWFYNHWMKKRPPK